jgi:hypothetical protein
MAIGGASAGANDGVGDGYHGGDASAGGGDDGGQGGLNGTIEVGPMVRHWPRRVFVYQKFIIYPLIGAKVPKLPFWRSKPKTPRPGQT